ncbi:MAG: citramalate synthase, partial [Verrucomicrobia bacterium]|nr:citramalate synthase [Verrucomicrobiota bacterium]
KGDPRVHSILAEVKRLESLGYEFEAAEASFELLVRQFLGERRPFFTLEEYHCSYLHNHSRNWNKCEATVRISVQGASAYTVAEGDGPVNALDAALRKALQPFYPQLDAIQLADYKVRIINGQAGTAARTRVLVTSTDGHATWGTVGVSDNIIEASWLALVEGLEYPISRLEGI